MSSPTPGRTSRAPRKSRLYALVAAGVVAAFGIAIAVYLVSLNSTAKKLADGAGRHVETERALTSAEKKKPEGPPPKPPSPTGGAEKPTAASPKWSMDRRPSSVFSTLPGPLKPMPPGESEWTIKPKETVKFGVECAGKGYQDMKIVPRDGWIYVAFINVGQATSTAYETDLELGRNQRPASPDDPWQTRVVVEAPRRMALAIHNPGGEPQTVRVTIAAAAGGASPVPQGNVHRNDKLGFSLPIPEGWAVEPGYEGEFALVLAHRSRGSGTFTLMVMDPVPGIAQGRYGWDDLLKGLTKSVQDLKFQRKEPGTCGGHPALLATCSGVAQERQKRWLHYLVAAPKNLYVLSWISSPGDYPSLEPVFEQTVRAFALTR